MWLTWVTNPELILCNSEGYSWSLSHGAKLQLTGWSGHGSIIMGFQSWHIVWLQQFYGRVKSFGEGILVSLLLTCNHTCLRCLQEYVRESKSNPKFSENLKNYLLVRCKVLYTTQCYLLCYKIIAFLFVVLYLWITLRKITPLTVYTLQTRYTSLRSSIHLLVIHSIQIYCI